jgi:hypothetical protein
VDFYLDRSWAWLLQLSHGFKQTSFVGMLICGFGLESWISKVSGFSLSKPMFELYVEYLEELEYEMQYVMAIIGLTEEWQKA